MNVSNIILKLFCFLNILKILTILIDLIIFVDEAPSTYKTFSTTIPKTEIIETTKSNTFQLSLKYLGPKAIIFKIASSKKIEENM
jgi:hypothetical protein